MRRLACAVVGVALVVAACTGGNSPATVGSAFDDPPAYPGPTWTRDGKPVPSEVIVAAAGPNHCGWQSATFLTVGWPIGTAASTAADARQYIRDPKGVTASSTLHGSLDLHARLPTDAKQTDFAVKGVALYLAPSDEDQAVYLVAGSTVERWPRSDPMTLCS